MDPFTITHMARLRQQELLDLYQAPAGPTFWSRLWQRVTPARPQPDAPLRRLDDKTCQRPIKQTNFRTRRRSNS